MRPFLLILLTGILVPVIESSAASSDLQVFTDKEKNEIEARILSISSDRRMLRIERSDEKMFEIEIIKLSLDSQQAVKEWLLAQPGSNESLKLELTAQRNDGESSREKVEGLANRATWEQQRFGYRIGVKSGKAGTASNLTLEYCLLLKERVSVSPLQELTEDNPVRWRFRAAGEVRYQRGSVELPSLRFNHAEFVDTSTMVYDSIRVSGGPRGSGEDEPIGLIVRVIDQQGRTIAEFGNLHRDYADFSWETLESRIDPQEAEGSGILIEQMVAR